jgi:hypothetical protein
MVRRWTDRALLAKFRKYLESLHVNEERVTPQETEQQLAVIEPVRARVEQEVSWAHSRTRALPREPTVGFPEINFVSPMGAGVFESDEE